MDKLFHGILDKYVPEFPSEETIVLPKLKKLNLPVAHNGKEAVPIVQGEVSNVKTTSETTLTKV